jgi:hypothetical protein
MFVVAKPHQVERAFGSVFPNELVEAAFTQDLIHRANPVGPFGMTRRGQVIEARPMRQQKRGHARNTGANALL